MPVPTPAQQITTNVDGHTSASLSEAATSTATLPLLESSIVMEGNGQTAQSSLDQPRSFEEPVETSVTTVVSGESNNDDATHQPAVDGGQSTSSQTDEIVSPIVLLPSNIHPGRNIRSNRRIRHSGSSTTSVPENYKSAYIEEERDTVTVATTVTTPSPTVALAVQAASVPMSLSAGSSLSDKDNTGLLDHQTYTSNISTRKPPTQHVPLHTHSSREYGTPASSVADLLESVNSIMNMSQSELEEELRKELDLWSNGILSPISIFNYAESAPRAPTTSNLLSTSTLSPSIQVNETEFPQLAVTTQTTLGQLSIVNGKDQTMNDPSNTNTSQLHPLVPEPHQEVPATNSPARAGTRNIKDGIETSAVCEAAPVQCSGSPSMTSPSAVAIDNIPSNGFDLSLASQGDYHQYMAPVTLPSSSGFNHVSIESEPIDYSSFDWSTQFSSDEPNFLSDPAFLAATAGIVLPFDGLPPDDALLQIEATFSSAKLLATEEPSASASFPTKLDVSNAHVHGIETESRPSETPITFSPGLAGHGSPPSSLPTEPIATALERDCRGSELKCLSSPESKTEWEELTPIQGVSTVSSTATFTSAGVGHTGDQIIEIVAEQTESPELAPILIQDSVPHPDILHASIEVDITGSPLADPSQAVSTNLESQESPVKLPESLEPIPEEQQVNQVSDKGVFSPEPLSWTLEESCSDASAQLPHSRRPSPSPRLRTTTLSGGDVQTTFHSLSLGTRDSLGPFASSSNEPSAVQRVCSDTSATHSPKNDLLPSERSEKDLEDGEISKLSIGDGQTTTVEASMSIFDTSPLTPPMKERPTKRTGKSAVVKDLDLEDLTARFGRFFVSDAGVLETRRRSTTESGKSHPMFGNLRYSAAPDHQHQPVPVGAEVIPEVASTTQAQADADAAVPVQPTRSEGDKLPELIGVQPPLSEAEKQSPAPQDTSSSNAAPVAEGQPNEETKNSLNQKVEPNTGGSSLFALSAEGRRAGRQQPDRATRYHLSMIREAQTAVERMGSIRKVSIALKEDLEAQRRPPVFEKVKFRIGCSSKTGSQLVPTGVPHTNPFAPAPSVTKTVGVQERKSANTKSTTKSHRRTHVSTPRGSDFPSACVSRHPVEPPQPPPVLVIPVVVCMGIVNEDMNDCHIPGAYPTVKESLEPSSHFPSFFNRIRRLMQHI